MEDTTSAIATLEETITEKEKQIERSVTYSCLGCTLSIYSYTTITVEHSYFMHDTILLGLQELLLQDYIFLWKSFNVLYIEFVLSFIFLTEKAVIATISFWNHFITV